MKFNIADIVEHPSYGVGIVVERCMSASGVNELYSVLFNRVLSNNGVKRVFGSDLKFCASRDIRLVAILKQQLEGLLSCEDVQIVEM